MANYATLMNVFVVLFVPIGMCFRNLHENISRVRIHYVIQKSNLFVIKTSFELAETEIPHFLYGSK